MARASCRSRTGWFCRWPDSFAARDPLLREPAALALAGNTFYLLRTLLARGDRALDGPAGRAGSKTQPPVAHAPRRNQASHGVDWEGLCITHPAAPEFVFELLDDTVRLRLLARSKPIKACGFGTGANGWRRLRKPAGSKPEILDDPRLEPATLWLRQLDWFTPEPGLWVGDANESFLAPWLSRGQAGRTKPVSGQSRLPSSVPGAAAVEARLIVKGSASIGWRYPRVGTGRHETDRRRLATFGGATSRFVKLPDSAGSSWTRPRCRRRTSMADLGVDGLVQWRSGSGWSRRRI